MAILSFSARCKDLFSGTLRVDDVEYELEGYVPDGLGIGGGDEVELEIDLQTGQILNWCPPTTENIQTVISEADEDGEDEDEDGGAWATRHGPEPEGGVSYVITPETGYEPAQLIGRPMNGRGEGAVIELYLKSEERENGGPVIVEVHRKTGWIEEKTIAGMKLLVMGPDPEMMEYTPSVSALAKDGSFLWMAVFGSSYSNVYLRPETEYHFELANKALAAQGYR